MNVPNILTIFRIILVGVFVYLFKVSQNYQAAAIVFCVAAATDVLDGYIARKFNLITNFGKLMDPVADKIMIAASIYCFVSIKLLPSIFLILILTKEITMIVCASILYKRKIVVYSKFFGKASSLLFSVGVVLTFFKDYLYPWNDIIIALGMLFSVFAIVEYYKSFCKAQKNIGNNETKDEVEDKC